MQTLSGTTATVPELPELSPGVTLLEATDGTPRGPVQALALNRVLTAGGPALWVGPGHHAVTTTMADLAPDRRVLDRVRVARGFTPYQHTALVRALPARVTADTSMVVLPGVDAQYRGDDIRGTTGRDLLVRVLAVINRVAREHDVPVLCTREHADDLTRSVAAAADRRLEYHDTPLGPRFVGPEAETTVYPVDGEWVQTTWAFWQAVLTAREPLYTGTPGIREVTADGAH